jgi:hypothetical protein
MRSTNSNPGGGNKPPPPASNKTGQNLRNQDISKFFPPIRQDQSIPPERDAEASKFPLIMPSLWLYFFQRDFAMIYIKLFDKINKI